MTTEAKASARGESPDDRQSGTDDPGLRGAPITGGLLAANVGVFLAQVSLGGGLRFALGGTSKMDHDRWTWIQRVLGANDSAYTIADTRLETLVTSVFLHGSVLHLLFNLFALWQVGPFLEKSIGRARFLPLYLASGIVASAFSAIAGRFFGTSISVGASGAICGLIGAVLVLGARTQGWRGPLTKQMALWLAFLFALGFLKNNVRGGMVQVDNAAHIGGALGGAIIAAAWRRGVTYGPRATKAIVGCSVAVIVLAGLVQLVRTRTDPYLFMGVEERMAAAMELAAQGRCREAESVFKRAVQMDPSNPSIRSLGAEVDRRCLAPPSAIDRM